LNHGKLSDSLENCDIRGRVLNWFQDYLCDRKFTARVKETFGEELFLKRGVPQGSVLGPKLYVLYVNDIDQVFSSCQYFMYADDLVILSFHENPNVALKNLQREIFQFQLWAHTKNYR